MDIYQSKNALKDLEKRMKVLIILVSLATLCFLFSFLTKEISWNNIIEIPKSGPISLYYFFLLLLPVIFTWIKNFYNKFKICYLSYIGKELNFEQWKELDRLLSIINQDKTIEYYKNLREQIGDNEIVNRIIDLNFVKGDKIEYIILSIGYPSFVIHKHLWNFYDKYHFYYFPYYDKKNLFNFFSVKFKYRFIFDNNYLSKFEIDNVNQF